MIFLKKMYNYILVFTIIFLTNLIITNNVYANITEEINKTSNIENIKIATETSSNSGQSKSSWKDILKLGDDFTDGKIEWKTDEKGQQTDIKKIENSIKDDASGIFKVLLAIGTVLTVIVGAILGISYMAASAEDKAKIKEKMIPYILGCIVIYGAFTIWYVVVDILGKIN